MASAGDAGAGWIGVDYRELVADPVGTGGMIVAPSGRSVAASPTGPIGPFHDRYRKLVLG